MSTPARSDLPAAIGESPAFTDMLEATSGVASLPRPVLVVGERGSGKELVAARLHFLSDRWDQPFIKLNCSTLTETLLETELFGHEPGAFTGATGRHVGRFERADGGTLFLDELATVPLRMQEKILRVIEYGEFERVGGSETLTVDVRVVGATNRDLPALARSGQFRPDLLDRLAFEVITVPPLRARREDILPLARHFAMEITAELGRGYFPGFSRRAEAQLLAQSWPGNVRELKNAIERSVYRMADPDEPLDEIVSDPFDSPWRIRETRAAETAADETGTERETPHETFDAPRLPTDLKAELVAFETRYLETALEQARYNQKRAAELLGLTYAQLRSAMRRTNLRGKSPN